MEREGKDETLPPGFRFHPSDEELITCYLINKISDASFTGRAITDVDLNKCEPWDLPGKAKMGEKEWYFFSLRDRKYPTGVRTNRATNTGYWKTTGKDKEIFNAAASELVGMKKTLVFYRGRAPRGEKTNWVMHEYRIHAKSSFRTTKDEWVVCRVFQKSAGVRKYPSNHHTRAVNPYNLETGAPSMPSHAMQSDPFHQFQMGRTYMTKNEMADLTTAYNRGGSTSMNMPIIPMSIPMQPQVNYPVVSGGGSFTISGLNLNSWTPSQQFFRQPAPPQPMNQQDVTSTMITRVDIGSEVSGYGVDMSNANVAMNNRFMNMEHCSDLDNYWAPY